MGQATSSGERVRDGGEGEDTSPVERLYRSRSSLTSLTSTAVNTVRDCLRRIGSFFLPSRARKRRFPSNSGMSESENVEFGLPKNKHQTEGSATEPLSNVANKIAVASDEQRVTIALVEVDSEPEKPAHDDRIKAGDDDDSAQKLEIAIAEVSRVELNPNVEKNQKQNLLKKIASEEFMDIPLLRDENTINWVAKNNVMVVMRGLPGSGKSTLVKAIVSLYSLVNVEKPEVCSADHHFIDDKGNYLYNPHELQSAHKKSQAHALKAVESGKKMIIIDNTNVVRWEMEHYFQLAEKFPSKVYRVVIVEPQTPWAFDPIILSFKNSHGVSEDGIRRKLYDFNVIQPIYYAWFLSRCDSQRLLREGQKILKQCFEVPSFRDAFQMFSSMINLKSALSYYNRDMCLTGNREIVHCTAKFNGNQNASFPKRKGGGGGGGKDKRHDAHKQRASQGNDEKDDFASRKVVKTSLGKCQKLKVIGFVFSKHTFGARVELSQEQLKLYDQPETDSERSAAKRQFGKPTNVTTTMTSPDVVDDSEISLQVVEKRVVPGKDFYPIPGIGKRAHITLGTSEGVRPVSTGIDLLEVVHQEKIAAGGRSTPETFSLPGTGSWLRRYSPNLWVVYPDQHLIFDSFFTGHY